MNSGDVGRVRRAHIVHHQTELIPIHRRICIEYEYAVGAACQRPVLPCGERIGPVEPGHPLIRVAGRRERNRLGSAEILICRMGRHKVAGIHIRQREDHRSIGHAAVRTDPAVLRACQRLIDGIRIEREVAGCSGYRE